MKIYFAGSITGGRDYIENYKKLVNILEKYGDILTKYVADENLTEKGEVDLTDEEIFKRDIEMLKIADLLIAEVSVPSLGVGYEIASAINFNKPVICLYHMGSKFKLSSLISGNPDVIIVKYRDVSELNDFFHNYFKIRNR